MNTWGKVSASTAIAALCVLAISGCAAGESSFADLRGEAKEGPALPATLPDHALESFKEETIRWIGSSDDTELWLGEGSTPDVACLLVYPADDQWSSTCTTAASLVELSDATGSFLIVPDSLSAPDETTSISENVYFRP